MRTLSFFLRAAAGLVLAGALSGCVGIYDNSSAFFNPPEPGMAEQAMLEKYGTPAFAMDLENGKRVYTYKVRDNKYIVLVGLYDGYDLVIACEDGEVSKVSRVPRAEAFTLFQPVPWAEAAE